MTDILEQRYDHGGAPHGWPTGDRLRPGAPSPSPRMRPDRGPRPQDAVPGAQLYPAPRRVHDNGSEPDEMPPADAVVSGAAVRYRIGAGPVQSGLVCHRSRIGGPGGVIPACSPLGLTLLGLRPGQQVPFPRDDGSAATLTLLSVALPG